MERDELLRKLAEGRYAYFECAGLPAYKCQQLVAENMEYWEKMPTEKLQELLDREEY